MTPQEVIDDLIRDRWLERNPLGYRLAIKGGAELATDTSLRASALRNDQTLRIIPITEAGKAVEPAAR